MCNGLSFAQLLKVHMFAVGPRRNEGGRHDRLYIIWNVCRRAVLPSTSYWHMQTFHEYFIRVVKVSMLHVCNKCATQSNMMASAAASSSGWRKAVSDGIWIWNAEEIFIIP